MQQQQQQQQLNCPKDMSSSPADGICVLRELPCQRNTIHEFKSEFLLSTKDNVIGKELLRQEFSSPQLLEETLDNFVGANKRHAWEKSRKRKRASMTAKKLETQMSQFFSGLEQNLAVVENSSICKMLATTCLAYLMGCSPCILGMLWEVTDADIDKMTAEFISSWITSAAKRSWSDVNLSAWSKGVIVLQFGSQHLTVKHYQMLLVAKQCCGLADQFA
ncbi:unnamed protein product [Trichogramma brassicae]|uniref:Uncharacterized protein n=1 Tax=Trichogramma brassicae TaxID=86971 RepID=A0A6H5IGU1_9HYME|nr:unnamed protein product [Trichogramma brassicae]